MGDDSPRGGSNDERVPLGSPLIFRLQTRRAGTLAVALAIFLGLAVAPAYAHQSSSARAAKTNPGRSTIYVLRGRVVQVIEPSGSTSGSVSFRVTGCNRLESKLKGMVITVALAKPAHVAQGAPVVVRLRAPVDVLATGFESAVALLVSPTT